MLKIQSTSNNKSKMNTNMEQKTEQTKFENQTEIIELGIAPTLSDVTLIYRNKQTNTETHFKVHSQVIANSCEYFKTLCEADKKFHEMEISDSIIEQTSKTSFHQFLQLLYDHNSVIFFGFTILPILHCAHYFDSRQVEADASKYLIDIIKSNKLPYNLTLIQILSAADTYKLKSVIFACVTQLLSTNDTKVWFEEKKNKNFQTLFSSLSSSTKSIIIAAMERELKVNKYKLNVIFELYI
jgi:hypothetical protein